MNLISNIIDLITDYQSNGSARALIYFHVKEEGWDVKVKKVNVNEETQNEMLWFYTDVLIWQLNYVEWNQTVLNIDNYDDTRKDLLYYMDYTQLTSELMFLNDISRINCELYTANSNDIIKWVIIQIETWVDNIIIYTPYYPFQTITTTKAFLMVPVKDQFETFTGEKIISFSKSIYFISHQNKLFVFDFEKLEKNYWFNSNLENKASNRLWFIQSKNILEPSDFLLWLISNDKKFRNMLLKIDENSKIFQTPIQKIKDYIQRKGRFEFSYLENWKFNIGNKTQAYNLLKLLTNAYLISEITGEEYEAISKEKIE
jgi:hypothetical protein